MNPFYVSEWFWIVGDDQTRAWSSATGGYVDTWDAERVTRIGSATDLNDVLRRHGLPSPLVVAADVRAEASRRMQALVGARDAAHLEIIVVNGTREAVRLLRKGAQYWSDEERARAAELEQIDAAFEAIRAASNAMEGEPPVDYASDGRWL